MVAYTIIGLLVATGTIWWVTQPPAHRFSFAGLAIVVPEGLEVTVVIPLDDGYPLDLAYAAVDNATDQWFHTHLLAWPVIAFIDEIASRQSNGNSSVSLGGSVLYLKTERIAFLVMSWGQRSTADVMPLGRVGAYFRSIPIGVLGSTTNITVAFIGGACASGPLGMSGSCELAATNATGRLTKAHYALSDLDDAVRDAVDVVELNGATEIPLSHGNIGINWID